MSPLGEVAARPPVGPRTATLGREGRRRRITPVQACLPPREAPRRRQRPPAAETARPCANPDRVCVRGRRAVPGATRASSPPAPPAGRPRPAACPSAAARCAGKRMAMPERWRVERCSPSKATSSTSPFVRLVHHLAHRAEAVDRVVAHEPVDLGELLVGEAEIGLADRHQLLAVLARRARRRRCSRNSRTSACRGRAGHTSARRRRCAGRAST